jgi:hypothetical protein
LGSWSGEALTNHLGRVVCLTNSPASSKAL